MLDSFQQDIINYIEKVLNDTEYKYPKFIPVALPRRFGKTTMVKHLLTLTKDKPNVKIVDNFEDFTLKEFMVDLIPWLRPSNNILIVFYTPIDKDSFTSTITINYPSIHGIMEDFKLKITFPDNKECIYDIDKDISFLSTTKETELHTIVMLFSNP